MPSDAAHPGEGHRLDQELHARCRVRVAPSALRTPISRVRWVTLTSMMFMTPTPPTSRAMPAITSIAAATPPVICWKFLQLAHAS